MNNWNLSGKRVLVTGGTKGIGLAVVEEFLALGATVAFTARNAAAVQALEQRLQQQGHQAWGLVGDVAQTADRQQILLFAEQRWGALDVLVNNAGMNIRKATMDYSQEEYRQVLEVNLIAPFALSRLLYPLLKRGQGACIINVASIAGQQDVGTGSPYAMSKAGLIQQSRSLAVEWAKEGLRVNTVSPWFTETPLTENYLSSAEKKEAITRRTPMGRVAKAEELAAAVAFLAMDKASYITGQNLVVDGGMSANAV
ncbi:MAG: SDR family oxidoreductase [Bacteroidetes bacterium]|nr:SDR family oxidoreductase [Bacteroidota bacterium]